MHKEQIEMSFRMPGASHWGFFTYTRGWTDMCIAASDKQYVPEYKDNPFDFCSQRLIIQSILLEGRPFREKKFMKKDIYQLLENNKISLTLLKYFLEAKEIDYFKFNLIRAYMVVAMRKNPSVLDNVHFEANSFALHKKLNDHSEERTVLRAIKI